MNDIKLEVYNNGKLIFELLGIKDVIRFSPDAGKVEIIVFKTSTGEDFVKINAEKTMLGIFSERAWVEYTYPGFEKGQQSLLQLKINESIVPCDLVNYINNETGEEKNIYFEISSFYGTDLM